MKRSRGLAGLAAAVLALTACSAGGSDGSAPVRSDVDPPPMDASKSTPPTRSPSGAQAAGWVEQQVDAMSLRRLAQQVQVVTVAGTRPRQVTRAQAAANVAAFGVPTPARVVKRFQPGGIVYFDENVSSVAQVRGLSRGLHRASRRAGTPSLLFTDQEGGLVSRLPGPVAAQQPAARDLGGDPRAARTSARRVGAAMSGMGLDVDFAPVADVDTVGGAGVIGTRSFGTTAAVVSRAVRAQTCGYHRGGVGVSLKHWPGHGSTRVDSHEALPELKLPLETWRRQHMPPFRTGIRHGADMVMTGHLVYERLDRSGRPASLSRTMTHDWLRHRLGFGGVIVTDSLEMAAVTDLGSAGQVAVRALKAGADMVLMSPSPRGATTQIRAAVADGRLTRSRLEASAARILQLKKDTGLVRGNVDLAGCRAPATD